MKRTAGRVRTAGRLHPSRRVTSCTWTLLGREVTYCCRWKWSIYWLSRGRTVMLSFLPSPFARSVPAPAATETNNKVQRSKPSLRRAPSKTKSARGGKARAGRKSNLGSVPVLSAKDATFSSRSDLPLPLIPPKSTFTSPCKGGVIDNDQEAEDISEDELEQQLEDEESMEARRMMEEIGEAEELYAVLGVNSKVQEKDLRRAYMARCRTVHPDKHPSQLRPMATAAFQSLSYAYETLSSPASRKSYDLQLVLDAKLAKTPKSSRDNTDGTKADETLNGVLHAVWCEFLDGDFEMIRSMVGAINETTSVVQVGDQTVETIQGAMERLRGILLSGGRYMRVVRFELIRLYEIQLALRQLGWFDIKGRVRLSIQLARVTIAIPLAIDKAMLADSEAEEDKSTELLGARVSGLLGTAVGLLEGSEAWLGDGGRQLAEKKK